VETPEPSLGSPCRFSIGAFAGLCWGMLPGGRSTQTASVLRPDQRHRTHLSVSDAPGDALYPPSREPLQGALSGRQLPGEARGGGLRGLCLFVRDHQQRQLPHGGGTLGGLPSVPPPRPAVLHGSAVRPQAAVRDELRGGEVTKLLRRRQLRPGAPSQQSHLRDGQ